MELEAEVIDSTRRHALDRAQSTGNDDEIITKKKRFENERTRNARRFSLVHSTEESNRSSDYSFYGSYAHLRKMLDYNYHAHYSKSRQWLHDSIIEDYIHNDDNLGDKSVLPCEPFLIFTVGVQGAGKRHTIKSLFTSGKLSLLSTVCVDADDIRRLLPEYQSYIEESPDAVDSLTQKECGYIAETLALAALQAGKNVVLDSSLRDVDWYQKFVGSVRKLYPNMKVALIHVVADVNVIVGRVSQKAGSTGRFILEEETRASLSLTTESHVQRMKSTVDYYCKMVNNDNDLILEAEGGWEKFRSFFQQNGTRAPKLERLRTDDMRNRASKAKRHRRRFSALLSSEENHKSNDPNAFFGPYAHIRKTIDYNYHSNYSFERQRFQDAIITEFLSAAMFTDKNGIQCTTPTEPWIVFTAGAMGAGKSYTLRKLTEKGLFPLMAFVRVDPDEIRRFFPEFKLYVEQNPELAGELTRKEAGFISEILTQAALQAGKNVLVDGSLRDSHWYTEYFQKLRDEYTGVRIAIIHISAPRDIVFRRAAERALTTGRVVPTMTLVRAIEQVPKSVRILVPNVDYYVEISNGDKIKLMNPPGQTWESFQQNWIQTCAWVPSKNHLMRVASKSSLSTLSETS